MATELTRIGRALGAPARVAMLEALFDGRAHTAGELARAARVSAATASEHLRMLVEVGLVAMSPVGRQRHFRLTDRAAMLEPLAAGADYTPPPVTSLKLSAEQRRVRTARTCYDHLAGQLGVRICAEALHREWVGPGLDTVTVAGELGFGAHFELDVGSLRGSGRTLVRGCMDWTERGPHLAGALGAAVAERALASRWVTRQPGGRGLRITASGRRLLAGLGIADPGDWAE